MLSCGTNNILSLFLSPSCKSWERATDRLLIRAVCAKLQHLNCKAHTLAVLELMAGQGKQVNSEDQCVCVCVSDAGAEGQAG